MVSSQRPSVNLKASVLWASLLVPGVLPLGSLLLDDQCLSPPPRPPLNNKQLKQPTLRLRGCLVSLVRKRGVVWAFSHPASRRPRTDSLANPSEGIAPPRRGKQELSRIQGRFSAARQPVVVSRGRSDCSNLDKRKRTATRCTAPQPGATTTPPRRASPAEFADRDSRCQRCRVLTER